MGHFFNKTRTPLSATTTKGHSVTFPSRTWVYVVIDEESSSSIQTYLRKGVLARTDAPADVAHLAKLQAAVRPAVAPVAAPVAAPKPMPVPVSAPVVDRVEAAPAPEPVVETPRSEDSADDHSTENAVTPNSSEATDPSAETVAPDASREADSTPRKHRRR